MEGYLLIYKPTNWTSFDVVAKIRNMIRAETGQKKPKVGHAGTLDPLAAGLLLILVGSYCKQAQHFSGMDKQYEARLYLGIESTTADDEGEKTRISNLKPGLNDIQRAIRSHQGDIEQMPPAFSAKKINGKRAYALARSGQAVTLKSQKVTIHDIQLVNYDYPHVDISTHVSSGTYIRSLATSIGAQLTTGAYLEKLRRTRIGSFEIENAVSIDQLENTGVSTHIALLKT